jgi:YqaJ-like viral recombinase domain
MRTNFVVCDQRSLDWYRARLGRLTGSRAKDAFKTLKGGGISKARSDYIIELLAERITGSCDDEDPYVSKAMQRGIDLETKAYSAYEARTGYFLHRSGFLSCDDVMAGASLDGHVRGVGAREGSQIEGIIEIKALNSCNHLSIIRSGTIPDEYVPQLTHNLWISGAQWCDFISFDDRFPPRLQLYIRRLTAAELNLKQYGAAVSLFLAEVEVEHKSIMEQIV